MQRNLVTLFALGLLLLFVSPVASLPGFTKTASETETGNFINRDGRVMDSNVPVPEMTLPNDTDTRNAVNQIFTAIIAIPSAVLDAGDNSTTTWLTENGYRSRIHPASWWQQAKCALAILAFIGTNLVSAAKLLRIKKYIEALGGASEAAALLLKCTTWAERLELGGTALVNLAAELFGVDLIKNACF